jgi:hypothetical protein
VLFFMAQLSSLRLCREKGRTRVFVKGTTRLYTRRVCSFFGDEWKTDSAAFNSTTPCFSGEKSKAEEAARGKPGVKQEMTIFPRTSLASLG